MRGAWGRCRLLLGGGAIAALALWVLLAAPVIGADPVDTTPPTGTLTINDGSEVTNDLHITLHVPATDDVGVVWVAYLIDGVASDQLPYTDTVEADLPDGPDGLHVVRAEWGDAAGNVGWSELAYITVDRVAPSVGSIQTAIPSVESEDVVGVRITAADGSQLSQVRLSADGLTWGPPVDWNPTSIDYHFLDPADGGGPLLGDRPLYVVVADLAGNWSQPKSASIYVAIQTKLLVTPDVPVTGQTITLTPDYPAPAILPSNAQCYWEVMWGDDQSLYSGNPDETMGQFMTHGPKSQGFCKPLSFTLPWMPYRQVIVSFRANTPDEHMLAEAWVGGDPSDASNPAITPVIGSTDRHIRSSNIPMAYVLPDDYTLTVGKPTTYRLYTVGGDINLTSKDSWAANFGHDRFIIQWGGRSFTFTPLWTGYVTVTWNSQIYPRKWWGASFDPRVRHPDYYRPNTTPPVQRITGGEFDGQVPVKLTWTGSDTGWGIAKYQLQRSVDGGPWRRVLSKRVKSVTQQLATGHRYRYRVRAIDKAGNKGYWDYGPTFRVRARGDSSAAITYRGAWSTVDDATATGGHLHQTVAAGARAIIKFKGRNVALVVPRGPSLGRVTVYVDGRLLKTLDLSAGGDMPRRILVRRRWKSVGTHRIKLVVQGTADRPAVDLDGFLVLR